MANRRWYTFLLEPNMPTWLTVVLAVCAAVGTYHFTPQVNEAIELNKTRASHIADAINELNKSIVLLSIDLRKLNFELSDPKSKKTEVIRADALDLITNLQWKIIDLRVILASSVEKDQLLKDLAASLAQLKSRVENSTSETDATKILTLMKLVSRNMTLILDRLYTISKLKESA